MFFTYRANWASLNCGTILLSSSSFLPTADVKTSCQATGGSLQARGLALAVAVAQHLAVDVVGEALQAAIRVMDAHHFPRRACAPAWCSGSAHRSPPPGGGARHSGSRCTCPSNPIALDLSQGVPAQVLGFVSRVDDGVRQAIFAVEVLGQLPLGVGLGEQVALVVIARLPGGAVSSYRNCRRLQFGSVRGLSCCRCRPARWRSARRRSRYWPSRGGRRCNESPARARAHRSPSWCAIAGRRGSGKVGEVVTEVLAVAGPVFDTLAKSGSSHPQLL